MGDYLTFEEAAAFLVTPHSTLYRWLREERVPGHKLGRQWRFLRSELEHFRSSGTEGSEERAALLRLAGLLRSRNNLDEETAMQTQSTTPAAVAEQLIWDAVDHGASVVHFGPTTEGHAVRYRTEDGLETLEQLSPAAFAALDRHLASASQATRRESRRRLFLERSGDDGPERLQVRYQKMETIAGERLTLGLLREARFPTSLNDITTSDGDTETLRRWSAAARGIVLVSGRPGSGKTTTAYCCLEEIARSGERVVFTIEDTVEFLLTGVNQVEVDLDDPAAYRRTFEDICTSDLDVLFLQSNVAQRHLSLLWGTALSAAESGHLVYVQLEADSPEDAVARFADATGRDVRPHLVGAVWQQLVPLATGRGREAIYRFEAGSLDG